MIRRRRSSLPRRLSGLALGAFALLAFGGSTGTALAASASVSTKDDRLEYVGTSWEKNNVTITQAGRTFTIVDTGATISAGTGCTALSANTVKCSDVPYGYIGYLGIGTYGGDDALKHNGTTAVYVDLGTGNDRASTGSGKDWISGNDGNDLLDGGPGGDYLTGGAGEDTADFSARTLPVTVVLDGNANDGQSGEGDKVDSSVEDVSGGAANDAITGSTGPNVLKGGSGNDTLDGGAGADSLDGGDGADALRARDGVRDTLSCGAGVDSVEADSNDLLDASCNEQAAAPAQTVLDTVPSAVRMNRRGYVTLRLRCPAGRAGRCKGTIVLRAAKRASASTFATASRRRALGRKRFSIRSGSSKTIKVKISRNGRRRVLAKRRLKCRASAVTGGRTTNKDVTVKAPRKGRS
jgi:hypothetical protein